MCYKILSGVTLSCNFKSSSWCMLFCLFTCVLHNFRIKNTPHSSIKWCLSQDKAWKFQQSYEPRPPLSWLIYNQNTSHQSHWRKGLGRVKRHDNRNFNIMWFIKRSFIFLLCTNFMFLSFSPTCYTLQEFTWLKYGIFIAIFELKNPPFSCYVIWGQIRS